MNRIRQFGRFWYDFIVGDDWIIAASVVVLVLATALVARRWNAWPLLPIGVAATLVYSLRRVSKRAQGRTTASSDG
jgi:hypothetical protein